MKAPAYTAADVGRFWQRVDRRGADECWPWRLATPAPGYGDFSTSGSRIKAHRAAYLIAHGSIPDGLLIDHTCRNRGCVNPAHLRAVTPRINSIENSVSFAAVNAAKTHCPQGHPLVEGNLVRTAPTRKCITCFREKQRERKCKAKLRRQGSLFGAAA